MTRSSIRPHSPSAHVRAAKNALFGVYMSALSMSTSPQARVGGQVSSLHGLSYAKGRPHRAARPLVWAVGPLWGA